MGNRLVPHSIWLHYIESFNEKQDVFKKILKFYHKKPLSLERDFFALLMLFGKGNSKARRLR